MWSMTWTVKVSKLCNLRCRYCYEWDDLANPACISLVQWKKILAAVHQYHRWQTLRFGEPGRTFIVWHGGEPLLMPPTYFEEVLKLQRDVLSKGELDRREFVNAVQTNLYRVQDEHLSIFERERFELGVSLDVVSGVRLNLAGVESESRVKDTLLRVLARQIPATGAVVLARHTQGHLREIYQFFESLRLPLRIIPFTSASSTAPQANLIIAEREMVQALQELFVYWIDSGAGIRVEPLSSALQTVLLHMTGLEQRPYRRRLDGDRLLIVNTDGTLYPAFDRYVPGRSLGNIFAQSLQEIFYSPDYEFSLQRDEQRIGEKCGDCQYRGACDTTPLVHAPYDPSLKHCRVYEGLCEFIESFVCKEGLDGEEVRSMLNIEQEGWYSVPLNL